MPTAYVRPSSWTHLAVHCAKQAESENCISGRGGPIGTENIEVQARACWTYNLQEILVIILTELV